MFEKFLKYFTLGRKNDKFKVIFDMDNVITDYNAYVIPLLNRIFGKSYKSEEITSWDFTQYYGADFLKVLERDVNFLEFTPQNDALVEFPKIYNDIRFEVWVVTACMTTREYIEKLQWFSIFFPDFPINRIISCKEKDTFWADMIVDDGLHNLDAFRLIGEPVVYDMPHNRLDTKGYSVPYKRVYSMCDTREYLLTKVEKKRNTQIA